MVPNTDNFHLTPCMIYRAKTGNTVSEFTHSNWITLSTIQVLNIRVTRTNYRCCWNTAARYLRARTGNTHNNWDLTKCRLLSFVCIAPRSEVMYWPSYIGNIRDVFGVGFIELLSMFGCWLGNFLSDPFATFVKDGRLSHNSSCTSLSIMLSSRLWADNSSPLISVSSSSSLSPASIGMIVFDSVAGPTVEDGFPDFWLDVFARHLSVALPWLNVSSAGASPPS